MKRIKTIAVVLTLLISAILGVISLGYFRDYGWTVFLTIPFLIGFLPPFIVGRNQPISRNESFGLSFLTLGIVLGSLLAFAIEGIICIAMASPLLIISVGSGSYLGYKSNSKNHTSLTNSAIGILLICGLTMGFDVVNKSKKAIPVKTKMTVNAPIEKVWENVVTFNEINEPMDWIFKTGISCPTDATIEGTGVGAIRYCNFTTGSFVEPITTWNEPTLLQFDVIKQPVPMSELNPFWEINPPHLEGYFASKKGQFRLNQLSQNVTELEGTTWYELDFFPQKYWQIWSNYIIHKIHARVLNHIKKEAEKGE